MHLKNRISAPGCSRYEKISRHEQGYQILLLRRKNLKNAALAKYKGWFANSRYLSELSCAIFIKNKMAKIFFTILTFFSLVAIAQQKGNSMYNIPGQIAFNDNEVKAEVTKDETHVRVRGLMNVKADAFLAVFSITQVGATASITDSLMEIRLSSFRDALVGRGIDSVHSVTDMISLVPRFDYNVIHKLFSKTYQEIPDGFELHKNVLVSYKHSYDLDAIVSAAASVEIYDLARVEYFVTNTKQHYDNLRKECMDAARQRIDSYSGLGLRTDTLPRSIAEDFQVHGPDQRYDEYVAVSRPSLREAQRMAGGISKFGVSDTPLRSRYYRPVSYSNYDIVINPIITEPVVQFTYDLRVIISHKPKAPCCEMVSTRAEHR